VGKSDGKTRAGAAAGRCRLAREVARFCPLTVGRRSKHTRRCLWTSIAPCSAEEGRGRPGRAVRQRWDGS
jgi:hypothetical protein